MRGVRGLVALGAAVLLVAASVALRAARHDDEPPPPAPPPQAVLPLSGEAPIGALAGFQLDTPIGRVGRDSISARDLDANEQRALQRLLGVLDDAKRETLSRLEEEALLALDRSPANAGEVAIGDAEVDAFLRSAPPLPAVAGSPRDLARHVLSLRAQRAARSQRLDGLRGEIPLERFVPSREEGDARPWPAVAARVGPRTITDADVEHEGRVRLFWLRSQLVAELQRAFASRADALLLTREAAARGTTFEALTLATTATAYSPSDADVDAELRRRGLTGDDRPERRARARELLVFRAGDARWQDLLSRLRAETPVAFLLAYPTPPRVEIAGARPGPGDPPVTLVAFTNLRCRICTATNEVLDAVEKGPHAGSVRVLRRPLFPEAALPLLVDAMAEACASEQGAGAAFRRAVIDAAAGAGPVDATALALATVAERDRFEHCLADPRTRATVESYRAEAERLGFEEAPGFLLNGLPLRGFQGQSRLEEIIAAETVSSAQPDATAATMHWRP